MPTYQTLTLLTLRKIIKRIRQQSKKRVSVIHILFDEPLIPIIHSQSHK